MNKESKTIKDILLFIPTSGGGAEKVSLNIAKILKRNGCNSHVIFVKGKDKNIMKFLSPDISYDLIDSDSHLKRYLTIIGYVKKYRPKVVFSSLTILSSILILCKLRFPRLKVVTRQCFTPADGNKWTNCMIKSLFRFADCNIAQTKEMKQQMIDLYNLREDKVIPIYNPLDTYDIDNKIKGVTRPASNENKFIAIGRIAPAKDYLTLLRAFAIVKKKIPAAVLTIIGHKGDEEYYNNLLVAVKELCIAEAVKFKDYTDNPYKELLNANCFVLSSVTEGLPNVMLEAMYLNLPCAATSCIPFISQSINIGVNGYTANVGNPEDLAAAMIAAAALYGKINNLNSQNKSVDQLLNIFKH